MSASRLLGSGGQIVVMTVAAGAVLTKRLYVHGPIYKKKDIRDMSDKVAIVTGASSGIGRETALEIARTQTKVVLACRDLNKAQKAKDYILKEVPFATVDILKLDLSDLSNVRDFARDFEFRYSNLDILVLNAGIMAPPRKMLSSEGVEMQFAVNHLGHFYLTKLLMDKLKATKTRSRVVVVSSEQHRKAHSIPLDDLDYTSEQYEPRHAYAVSKLANVLFAKELDRRHRQDHILSMSVSPGLCDTNLFHYMKENPIKYAAFAVLYPFWIMMTKSSWNGAQTSVFCALNPFMRNSDGGSYFENNAIKQSSSESNQEFLQRKLWDKSEEYVRRFEARESVRR